MNNIGVQFFMQKTNSLYIHSRKQDEKKPKELHTSQKQLLSNYKDYHCIKSPLGAYILAVL